MYVIECDCVLYAMFYMYPLTCIVLNFKSLAIFCGCKARFVSGLVGNPEDRFPHDKAHIRGLSVNS